MSAADGHVEVGGGFRRHEQLNSRLVGCRRYRSTLSLHVRLSVGRSVNCRRSASTRAASGAHRRARPFKRGDVDAQAAAGGLHYGGSAFDKRSWLEWEPSLAGVRFATALSGIRSAAGASGASQRQSDCSAPESPGRPRRNQLRSILCGGNVNQVRLTRVALRVPDRVTSRSRCVAQNHVSQRQQGCVESGMRRSRPPGHLERWSVSVRSQYSRSVPV